MFTEHFTKYIQQIESEIEHLQQLRLLEKTTIQSEEPAGTSRLRRHA